MGELIEDERIIMTPRKKTARSTIISMERKLVEDENGAAGGKVFVAGGSHKGLIINKEPTSAVPDNTPPKLTLEFRVFLVSASTKEHTQESRTLWFWFKSGLSPAEEACSAQEFFKELVSPVEFPRDYVGFIKKIMKLMQNKYRQLRRVEVELKQLDEYEKYSMILPLTDYEADNLVEVTEARVLEIIESSFPNPISVTQIASQTKSDPRRVSELLTGLQDRGTVTTVAPDTYTRATKNEDNVRIVRQMPRIVRSQQPTVAIITAQYCEKLAVDSMIDDLETFVRFNTVGESNVYSLGTIGHHRVVATKLPSVGHTREAMIAAGNTTTRLLGTFQKVEHVFLVGVGGGVPHYTDYSRHIRLGDVVVSAPISDKRFIYMYCEKSKSKLDDSSSDQEENIQVETKTWCPPMLELQELAARLKDQTSDSSSTEWQHYMKEGMERLSDQEMSFARPPPDSDKLYMSIGGSDVIEVAHPASKNEEKRSTTTPRIHLGPIGCGREISRNDILRQEISYSHGVLAYDSEFDQVLESIYGNRKDNYVVIRGVSDYADGTGCRGNLKEWQPYASLVASSVMKALICAMPSPVED